jgi:hypothetical protein
MLRKISRTSRERPDDVGTLWTMLRTDHTARCALIAWPRDWEIRVLVDGEPILSERCGRTGELFAVAERWRHRMLNDHWQQIVPPTAGEQPSGPQPYRRTGEREFQVVVGNRQSAGMRSGWSTDH